MSTGPTPARRSRWGIICSAVALTALGFFVGRHSIVPAEPRVQRQPTDHLNRGYHFTQTMRDQGVEAQLKRYRSTHDGSTQSLLILRPAQGRPKSLWFFFHGMSGDCGDGVVVHNLVTSRDALVVCPGGRGPSWLSDAFVADVAQVISEHADGFSDFHLAGISMGGTQALALAALLPVPLRDRLAGVMALIPEADLVASATRSSVGEVRASLMNSSGGDLEKLRARSACNRLRDYKKGLPFVILYNEADTVLPVAGIKQFITELRGAGHPVVAYSAPGEHSFVYSGFDFGDAFSQLGKSSGPLPVPTVPTTER